MNNTKRIAIIGAGAAGVHMAVGLKKRGFTDIVIFEKSHRIGGKTQSINQNGLSHEMGTTAFAMSKGAALELLIRDIFPELEGVSYRTNIQTITKNTYLKSKSKRTTRFAKISKLATFMYARYRFYKIYNRLVKKGYPYQTNSDDREMLMLLGESLKSFLLRHKLNVIYRVLRSRFAAYGYGKMEQLPAYYGILLLERNYLSNCEYLMFNEGNDLLWKAAVEKYAINVELNTSVTQLNYSENNKSSLEIRKGQVVTEEQFDAVFLTVPYAFTTQLPEPISKVFKEVKHYQYLSTLIEMSKRDQTNRYYMAEYPKYNPDRFDYDIVMAANFSKIKNTSNIKWAEENGTHVCFQLNDNENNRSFNQDLVIQQLEQQIKERFDRAKGLDKVLEATHWDRYFPHLTSEVIQKGGLQTINKEQGKYGIYYTGGSISGELVSLVVEYNQHILQNIIDKQGL